MIEINLEFLQTNVVNVIYREYIMKVSTINREFRKKALLISFKFTLR